jgi:hypothetical protein
MAVSKRVIILEQLSAAPPTYRYAMWADVPAARQPFYAARQAGIISEWKDASAGDNTALQNGSVTERVDQTVMNAGDSISTAMTRLQAIWTAFQTEITATNQWNRYGSFMDTSNQWNAGGVN